MKLRKRERKAVIILLAVTVIVAVYRLVLEERVSEMRSLSRSVPEKEKTLENVRDLRVRYLRKQSEETALRKKIEGRGARFDGFVFLKQVAENAGLRDRHTISLQPYRAEKGSKFTRQGWRVELRGVSQPEIGDFLRRVYAADKLLLVPEFTITPEQRTEGLRAEIQVLTLFLK